MRSLSARLLVLTIFFVMLSEVLIYTPSIANFRLTWLNDRLANAHLAALAVVASPEGMVTAEMERELLEHVEAEVIDMVREGDAIYMLGSVEMMEDIPAFDLTDPSPIRLVLDAFESMFFGGNRLILVSGLSPRDNETFIMMVMDDSALMEEMIYFSWRILGLSLVISFITAGLVFLSLRWLLVRPMTRMTDRIIAFRDDPEDATTIASPTTRRDELGEAERALHDMQLAVRTALAQQRRLAALGGAMTKINHDLRNILATASLVSESLAASDDPKVRRSAPRVLEAIDRAVELCRQTLAYTREEGMPVERVETPLGEVIDEARAEVLVAIEGDTIADRELVNEVPPELGLRIDARQMTRVFANIFRNAFEAGAMEVRIGASSEGGECVIRIADNGPGMPPRAQEHIFKPFAGSARPGGTGLGLAIAREIVLAHRGELTLQSTGPMGTVFLIRLPV
ncbi:MAG: HAMP domain-containing sensor histidine kinase [Azospirillaceae bacterium]